MREAMVWMDVRLDCIGDDEMGWAPFVRGYPEYAADGRRDETD